jgi:integrase/recombinase XerD
MVDVRATVTRFLDNRNVKKDGRFPVKLTIYYRGKKKVYHTRVDLSKDEYEALHARNLRDDELKKKRRKLEALVLRAEDIISQLDEFSFENFDRMYSPKPAIRQTGKVEELFDEYINQLEHNEQIGTAISYNSTKNSLDDYRKELKITDLTTNFLHEYERFMHFKGLSPSTIGIYMRQLRRIVNVAINKGLLSAEKYPFKGYTIPTSRNIKKALNENQIITLLNYQTDDLHKRRALDFWLFSYVCNGMNMADICLLTKDRIEGDFFHYFRAKTKNTKKRDLRPIKVPLSELSRQVMRRWGADEASNRYVFPILHDGLKPRQVKYKIQDFTYYVNTHMKLVATDVGITGNIGTYVARHTHSTILKRKGVPTEFIKENLGHSSILTTESYLADFTDETKIKYALLLTNLDHEIST